MPLLERYIFRRALAATALVLVAVTAILQTVQVMNEVHRLARAEGAALMALELAATTAPAVLAAVAPLALLLAVLWLFAVMNRDGELQVLGATGAGPLALARPILALGGLVAGACLLSMTLVEPATNARTRAVIERAGAEAIRHALRSGDVRMLAPNVFVRSNGETPDGRLAGIVIADFRDPEQEVIYLAPRGDIARFGGGALVLRDGEVHRRRTDGGIGVVSFTATVLDLMELAGTPRRSRTAAREIGTPALIEILRSAPPGPAMARLEAEILRRFSDWAYPLAFAAVVVAIAGRPGASSQGRILLAAAAAAVALTLRGLGFFAQARAPAMPIFAGLALVAPLAPVAILACAAAWGDLRARRPRRRPMPNALQRARA